MTTQIRDSADLDGLWNYDRPDESERRFRAALADLPEGTPLHVEALTQIARAQGLQRRFAEAHATLDAVLHLLEAAPLRAQARYMLERGRVLNSSGHPADSTPLFLRAWELASAGGDLFYAIDAAHMLGIVEPPDRGLDWNVRALALAESAEDPRARRWGAALANNIGWTYHDQGDYPAALDYFERALRQREADGNPANILIARWCVARALRSFGRVEEALAAQRDLATEHERAGTSSGYVEEELGECLLLLGYADEARPHFARAYARLSADPWLVEGEPARLERLRHLGAGVDQESGHAAN